MYYTNSLLILVWSKQLKPSRFLTTKFTAHERDTMTLIILVTATIVCSKLSCQVFLFSLWDPFWKALSEMIRWPGNALFRGGDGGHRHGFSQRNLPHNLILLVIRTNLCTKFPWILFWKAFSKILVWNDVMARWCSRSRRWWRWLPSRTSSSRFRVKKFSWYTEVNGDIRLWVGSSKSHLLSWQDLTRDLTANQPWFFQGGLGFRV